MTRIGSHWRFWVAAYILLVLLAGTNFASALYGRYERTYGISPLMVTLVYATYVAALIPSLLILGPLADTVGRRRILLLAITTAAAGALLLAAANGIPWLFAGRVLQGVAVGTGSGCLTALLADLEPSGNPRRAALVTTITSVGGLGLGAFLAALLVEYAPAAMVTPYLVAAALLVPASAGIAVLPAGRPTVSWRPRRPRVPTELRHVFLASGAVAFLAFAVTGVALSLVPTYVALLSRDSNLVLGGGAVALMLGSSSVVQGLAYGRSPTMMRFYGLVLLAAGLVVLAISGAIGSLPLLLAASVVIGGGQGLAFLSAITQLNNVVPRQQHAEVLSGFYVLVYIGVGLPTVGVGLLAMLTKLLTAVGVFAAIVAALCLVAIGFFARRRLEEESA